MALCLPRLLVVSWNLLIIKALILPLFCSISWECLGADIWQFDLPGYFALFQNKVLIDRTQVIRFKNDTTINLISRKREAAVIASWISSSARSAHPEIVTSVQRSIPKRLLSFCIHCSLCLLFLSFVDCLHKSALQRGPDKLEESNNPSEHRLGSRLESQERDVTVDS